MSANILYRIIHIDSYRCTVAEEGPEGGTEGRTCPACGQASQSGPCKACSAKERIEDLVASAKRRIDEGWDRGAEMKGASDLLTGARLMLEAGCHDDAEQLAGAANDLAMETVTQFDALVIGIMRSRRCIEEANEAGSDTSEAERVLEMAKRALAENNYREGMALAMKSRDMATREMRKYESWRVEVGSWMKR